MSLNFDEKCYLLRLMHAAIDLDMHQICTRYPPSNISIINMGISNRSQYQHESEFIERASLQGDYMNKNLVKWCWMIFANDIEQF